VVKTLLVGTTNLDKLREIATLLSDLPIELRALTAYPSVAAAAETGATYLENARLKAVHYARETGLLTMAEDTGFEVDALAGEPGLRSARFLASNASFGERFQEIYRRLHERRLTGSAARFVCALVLATPDRIMFETQQAVEGALAPQPCGVNGHGYDPIFLFPPLNRTFGEMSEPEKSAVSHRGQAVRALREFLKTW
jgi:XTP/dITP diphosphohydrolase